MPDETVDRGGQLVAFVVIPLSYAHLVHQIHRFSAGALHVESSKESMNFFQSLAILIGGRTGDMSGTALNSSLLSVVILGLIGASLIEAVLTITSRQASTALLWFAMLLLSNCGIYVLQGAQFLASMTVLLYAGMLSVTSVFLVRLSKHCFTSPANRKDSMLACLVGVLLSVSLIVAIHYAIEAKFAPHADDRRARIFASANSSRQQSQDRADESLLDPDKPHVRGFGTALYATQRLSLLITGVLLLVSVVGAVLIVQRAGDERRTAES